VINIRKIVLLSALLMSASSITAPAHAMLDDGEGLSAPRVVHAHIPIILTQDMIPEIRQHRNFFAAKAEWALLNPEKLDSFASYLNLKPGQYDSFSYSQRSAMRYTLLHYCIDQHFSSRYPNPNYNSARPEETEPEWIEMESVTEVSRLTFEMKDLTPPKPLAVAPIVEEKEVESGAASSVQAPVSSDSSSEDAVKAMIIRSLTETYKSDPEALGKAMAAFLANLK
jgi:hypothetical protein